MPAANCMEGVVEAPSGTSTFRAGLGAQHTLNVVLLGAGASRSYTDSLIGVPMPLAHDFFDVFNKTPAAHHPWVMSGDVWNYIAETSGLTPDEFIGAGFNIEEFHSEIQDRFKAAMETGEVLDRLHLHKVYTQLIFLFAYVINEAQNGPTSRAHRRLASILTDEDVIITFNWDTLMDRALSETGRWSTTYGYGVRPLSIMRGRWTAPSLADPSSGPRLIKLHGSTNWITSVSIFKDENTDLQLMQEAAPDSLFVYEHATPPYDTYAGRYMVGFGPFAFGYYPPNVPDRGKRAPEGRVLVNARFRFPWMPEGCAGEEGLTSISLIIPPVKRKEYDYYGDLFATLWRQAEEALTRARKITLIGYSFPETDVQSRALFATAMKRRDRPAQFTVINPDPARPARILSELSGVAPDQIRVHAVPFTADFDRSLVFG